MCLWIVLKAYPPAILRIDYKTITLSFDRSNFFGPSDFTFNIADITSLNRKELNGDEYVIFEINHSVRKFQISARSYDWEDTLEFSNVIDEIAEMIWMVNCRAKVFSKLA